MRRCLQALGVEISDGEDPWRVEGVDGRLSGPGGTLDAAASGTTARFVTAAATLAGGPSTIDGTPRMRERPIGDLVTALKAMGGEIETPLNEGFPPVRVAWRRNRGRRGDHRRPTVVAVRLGGPHGRPVLADRADPRLRRRRDRLQAVPRHHARGDDQLWRQGPIGRGRRACGSSRGDTGASTYAVEADASAAAYPFAAAAITGGVVRVEGIPSGSTQADLGLLGVLEAMGCEVSRTGDRSRSAARRRESCAGWMWT